MDTHKQLHNKNDLYKYKKDLSSYYYLNLLQQQQTQSSDPPAPNNREIAYK